ncbi:MAG: ribosome hibernation-promoting factor, HPF/YfiA family [Acidimicrobiia bacterium]
MDIVVRGRNRRVPPRLQGIAREKLAKINRFTHDAGRIEVDFSELRNHRAGDNQVCEVTVHLKRHFVKAHAAAREPEAALDLVIDKVEHQVARIKDKRVARSHPRRGAARRGLTPLPEAVVRDGEPALIPDDEDEDEEEEGPRIVKTKQFAIKPMTPEEAALQMDLLGHDFFLFTNAENGHAALLYRRRDGDLGLIETTG